MVALGALVGVIAGSVLTWLTPREYAAAVTIYVSARAGEDGSVGAYQASLLSEQMVKSYTHLITGTRVAQGVVDKLGLEVPAATIAEQVEATAQPDTVLLTVTVTDRSPRRARDVATATAEVFTELVVDLERQPDGQAAPVSASVVEPAVLPIAPVSPRPVVDVGLGLLFGLTAGYLLALARDALDNTVRTAEELAELTGVPTLGTVAHDPQVPAHPLTVHEYPHSPRAEAFRKLRTNLRFVDVDQPRKTVMVTSTLPEEGKTTTVCNVAIALAQAGTRVVLVEADLRRPRVVDYLGLEGAVGVTTVLAGQASLDEVLQPWHDGLLSVLASGPIPPNPSELLGSRQMTTMLAELRERYDIVLLDAPPLLPVTDAVTIGAACDGALLVVRYARTSTNHIRSAITALEAASVRLFGTVFAMTPDREPRRYRSYYQADWIFGREDTPPFGMPLAVPPQERATRLDLGDRFTETVPGRATGARIDQE